MLSHISCPLEQYKSDNLDFMWVSRLPSLIRCRLRLIYRQHTLKITSVQKVLASIQVLIVA
ncbi:hypothetical protein Hanom_Chr15g01388451 [Helianthus anomalus]